jgi:glycosyltransferase involved in cell wall biosynthesis
LGSVKEKYNLPERFILFTGGLDFRKNIETLLAALKLIIGKHDYKLIIVGRQFSKNRSLYFSLKEHARELKIDDVIVFLQHVNDDELLALYNMAQLFIFPSLFEGFGLPPLEAMACGCPVLSSNRCSLPEVVADAGIFFDPESPEMLASEAERILCSPRIRSELSKKGTQRATLFSCKAFAQNTLSAYQKVAGMQ